MNGRLACDKAAISLRLHFCVGGVSQVNSNLAAAIFSFIDDRASACVSQGVRSIEGNTDRQLILMDTYGYLQSWPNCLIIQPNGSTFAQSWC